MFLLNMSFISLVKGTIIIFHSWLPHSWNINIVHFTREIKDIFNKNIWISSIYLSQHMRFWYLSHFQATKAQVSMHICVHWPEHFLLAYTKHGYRWRLRPVAVLDRYRHLKMVFMHMWLVQKSHGLARIYIQLNLRSLICRNTHLFEINLRPAEFREYDLFIIYFNYCP